MSLPPLSPPADIICERPLMASCCCCRSTRWWIWMDRVWQATGHLFTAAELYITRQNWPAAGSAPRMRECGQANAWGPHPPNHLGSGHYHSGVSAQWDITRNIPHPNSRHYHHLWVIFWTLRFIWYYLYDSRRPLDFGTPILDKFVPFSPNKA